MRTNISGRHLSMTGLSRSFYGTSFREKVPSHVPCRTVTSRIASAAGLCSPFDPSRTARKNISFTKCDILQLGALNLWPVFVPASRLVIEPRLIHRDHTVHCILSPSLLVANCPAVPSLSSPFSLSIWPALTTSLQLSAIVFFGLSQDVSLPSLAVRCLCSRSFMRWWKVEVWGLEQIEPSADTFLWSISTKHATEGWSTSSISYHLGGRT